jgi:hypothetical protein
MLRRMLLLLSVALPLAALDLTHKLTMPTEGWAYHPRGLAWVGMSAAVVLGCLSLTRVPSAAVAAMAGVLAAGAGGNGASAIVWERGIPNPLVADVGEAVIAFNLADILALVGVLLLMVELSSVTIRNREQLLPPREFARMLWRRVRPSQR